MKTDLFLKKAIKAGLYLCLLTPLVVVKSTFFPYIFSKAIFFQVLIELLLILYLLLLFLEPEMRPEKTTLGAGLLLYLLLLGITSLTAVCPGRAFWGTQERMTGLFSLLHFGGFFVLLSGVFKKEKEWMNLFRFFLLVSVAVGAITLFGLGMGKGGTLGNPGFLASYLLFAVFFAVFLFSRDKNLFFRFLYIGVALLSIFLVYKEQRRAALAALFLGFFLLFILLVLSKRGRVRIAFLFFLILVLIGGVYTFKTMKQRFFRGSRARVISWEISWRAFKARPLLGWGPENYIYAFSRHFDPGYAEHSRRWLDKAHNQYFESLVTTGIFGFLSYLSLFGITLWNYYKKRNFVFFSLILAYMFNGLFWFDTTSSLIPLFLIFSFSTWTKESI